MTEEQEKVLDDKAKKHAENFIKLIHQTGLTATSTDIAEQSFKFGFIDGLNYVPECDHEKQSVFVNGNCIGQWCKECQRFNY